MLMGESRIERVINEQRETIELLIKRIVELEGRNKQQELSIISLCQGVLQRDARIAELEAALNRSR